MPKNKGLFWLCALLGLAQWALGSQADFAVYHQAAADFFRGGWSAVYSPQALTPFKYHPFTVWMFALMGWLAWPLAAAAWAVLNVFFTYDACRRFQNHFQAADWMPVAALCCVGHAWSWQVKFGNVTCLMLWLFALFATHAVEKGRAAAAAALVLLKPFWVVILPVFVLGKSWKTLSLALGLVAAGCLAVFLTGFDDGLLAYELWQKTLADPTNAHNYPKNDNQCLYAILFRGGDLSGHSLTLVWALLSGVYFVQAALIAPSRHDLRALAVLPPMLFAGPLSWIHHQILLLPLFIFLLSQRLFGWAAAAALFLTGLGEGILGREFFVLSHQMGLPVLGFLVLSAALAKSAERGVK